MSTASALAIFALLAVASFVVFLVIRQGVLWYWRINDAVALLERIEMNTRRAGTEPREPQSGKPRSVDQMLADARAADRARERRTESEKRESQS